MTAGTVTFTVKDKSGNAATLPLSYTINSATAPLWGVAYSPPGHTSSQEPPLELETVRTVGVHRTYWESTQTAAALTSVRGAVTAGRVAWPSFKLPVSWASAKTGGADAWADGIYQQYATLGKPIMLTFHHEPEGDQSPITDFLAAHQRLYARKPVGTQIKVGPIFIAWEWFYSGVAAYDPNLITAALGDFIGWDVYCYYLTAKNGGYWEYGPTYFQKVADVSTRVGRPWAIGEWGVSNDSAAYQRSQAGDVYQMRNAWASANSIGNCLALAYFDSGLNSTTNPSDGTPAWPLSTDTGTPSKQAVWMDILRQSPLAPAAW